MRRAIVKKEHELDADTRERKEKKKGKKGRERKKGEEEASTRNNKGMNRIEGDGELREKVGRR